MDFRKVAVWAVTIFVGLIFLMSGAGKIAQGAMWQERFVTEWGLPAWLATVTGLMEIAGGLLILLPRTAMYGGALIAMVMLGAMGTHAMAGQYPNILFNVVLGSMAASVAWFRCPWGGKEE